MSNDENSEEDRLLQSDILAKAQDLLNHLQSGDVAGARTLIGTLNEIREDSLFMELGKLTRELHETLKDIDVGVAAEEIPNARNRLSYVIELTEQAANKTMDGIEATIPMSDQLAKEAGALLQDWGRFKRREMTVEEFRDLYKEMMVFLESVESTAGTIHDNLQEVLLAQNFQDLTGQAIKKVMDTVTDLERRLVQLVKLASEANRSFGEEQDLDEELIIADETDGDEEETADEKGAEVRNQDEVDKLLSDLGF